MKKSRIQHAAQQQDWLDIIIDRANLKLAQNSAGVPNANQASLNSPNKLIVPSITRRESNHIINDVFGFEALNRVKFLPVSKRLIIRYLIFPIMPIALLLLVSLIANQAIVGAWIGFGCFCIFMVSLAVLRWYRWGYFIDEDFVIIRKGLFGKDLHIFSKQKMQQVKLLQTVFMHKYKKATVKFVLASSAHTIPYIDETLALSLVDDTLMLVERDKPAWM